ncbi:MAG: M20 family peptidase [Robiginitomaculum sp.]|nr:M20 family peptidase [Robiginitomaculum sp.]
MRKSLKMFFGVFALLLVTICVMLFRTLSVSKPTETRSVADQVLIVVDKNLVAQNLAKAVQFKTVTAQNREDTDWQVFLDFQAWLLETYPDFYKAVQSQQIETYAQFHVWQGSDPSLAPIVFLAHQDVVPALEADTGWDFPPFGGVIADGFINGRGTIDDKGSLIGLLEAADRLVASGFKPKRTLMFGFGHDEEVSGSGAKAIAELLKSQGISPYAVIDEGGVITTGMPDVKGPVARIGVAEKGYLTLVLTARAQGGHSSVPPNYTAIGALAKAIAAIEANPFESGLDKVSIAMLKATASEQEFMGRLAIANLWLFKPLVEKKMREIPTGRAMLGTTIAPTIIKAGFKENALPRDAVAHVNFRLHSRDTVASVTEHVRRVINDKDIEISLSGNIGAEASPISQIGSGPYLWLEDVVNQAYPGTIIAPNTVLGGTDSRYFALVTNDIYRFAPYVLDASDFSRFHGLNERMSIENFAKTVQVYHLMLKTAGE